MGGTHPPPHDAGDEVVAVGDGGAAERLADAERPPLRKSAEARRGDADARVGEGGGVIRRDSEGGVRGAEVEVALREPNQPSHSRADAQPRTRPGGCCTSDHRVARPEGGRAGGGADRNDGVRVHEAEVGAGEDDARAARGWAVRRVYVCYDGDWGGGQREGGGCKG